MRKNQASLVGIVLGAVFIIMGFASNNSGVWILGLIFLAIVLWMKFKKK